MDITLTIHITEKQIPELIGLLAKIWDNPDPTKDIEIHDGLGQKTVWVMKEAKPEQPASVPPAAATAPVVLPVPPPLSPELAPTPTTPNRPNAAQVQAAAGAFVALDANNITVLQSIMQEFGVTAFPALKDEQLDAFVKRLRDLGVAV
jgi:hypothetical protein